MSPSLLHPSSLKDQLQPCYLPDGFQNSPAHKSSPLQSSSSSGQQCFHLALSMGLCCPSVWALLSSDGTPSGVKMPQLHLYIVLTIVPPTCPAPSALYVCSRNALPQDSSYYSAIHPATWLKGAPTATNTWPLQAFVMLHVTAIHWMAATRQGLCPFCLVSSCYEVRTMTPIL